MVKWLLPITGLVSLLWFLVRVIPKPSRAAYPCQRVAFPLASEFVVWLTGGLASVFAYRKARGFLDRSRFVAGGVLLAVSVAAIWVAAGAGGWGRADAAFAPSDSPNSPIGIGKGIHPGRVVWVHDADATSWDGSSGNWWDDANTSQKAVDAMVSQAIRTLTGQSTDAAAWNALFRYSNRTRGLGDVGYRAGEKIAIKINMNQDQGRPWSGGIGVPSPQMIHALLDQLIHTAGVPGGAITIFDASRAIGDPIIAKVRGGSDPNFQAVRFVVSPGQARGDRIAATHDPNAPIHFAGAKGLVGYLPQSVTEAKYLINLALLRGHSMFGVTLCGKNYFGTTYFPKGGGWTPQPLHGYGGRNQAMGSYNCLVDLIGHRQTGGKVLLYMVEGLYVSLGQNSRVVRFASFGDDWCSSLFVSQDPVAIDSGGLDVLRNEAALTNLRGRGVDNYLHEAALAGKPPSGMVYDPEEDGKPLESLGVHEHWNNPKDRKYSRNLGKTEGIELVAPPAGAPTRPGGIGQLN